MSISQFPSGWTITRSDERIVVQHVSGSFYAAAKEGDSGIAESILYMLADSLLSATLSPAHIEDEREACERWIRQRSGMPAHIPMDWYLPFNRYTWAAWSARAELAAPPAAAGVPEGWRELAQQAADALQVFTGHDSGPNLRHRYGKNWWEPLDQLRDKLRAMLKAPTPPAAGVPVAWFTDWPGSRVYAAEPHGFDEPGLHLHGESIAEQWAPLYAAPTPPASEQQRAVVMPERKPYPDPGKYSSTPDLWPQRCAETKGWNDYRAEFMRLNPHLAKGEGV